MIPFIAESDSLGPEIYKKEGELKGPRDTEG